MHGELGPPARTITIRPPAKLNLTLEVLGRRADGYHDLLSALQAIDLRDKLTIAPAESLELKCSRPDLSDEANLAYRAAAQLRAEAGVSLGARITLEKRIPVAAGLGGGSADAAAVLVGLATLWGLRWPTTRLAALAARLGSDVPFFLGSPTALAAGRGERLMALPALPAHWAVVACPVPCAAPPDKTRRLYAALRPEDFRDGSATHAVAAAIEAGAPLDPRHLVNSFERAAREEFPEVASATERMLAAGAPWVRLAGSGPCLFTLLRADGEDSRRSAAALAERLTEAGWPVFVARTLGPRLAISEDPESG